MLECIKNKNTFNKNYNVSSGKATSIIDLANKIKYYFPNLNIIYDDVKEGEISKLVEGRERLNQELTHLYLDNTKAKNDTNWKPSIDFDEGIKMYIKWAKTNMKNWDLDYKV